MLTLAGYWAGRYGETTGRGRRYAPALAAFAISILAGLGEVALHFLLGEPVAARDALVTALPSAILAAVLALGVIRVTRVMLSATAEPRACATGGARVSTHTPYGEPRAPSSRFLPPDPGVEAPYRLTPGLAFRVGVLGVVALAVFAVLFFRLWSLQVLSGDTYLAAGAGQPAADDPARGAARDDPRPPRPHDRRQRRRARR